MQQLRKILAFAAILGAVVLAVWVLWPRRLPLVLPTAPPQVVQPRVDLPDAGVAALSVEGRVLDGEGHGIAGARVEVASHDQATRAAEPAGELGILRGPIPYPPLQPIALGPSVITDEAGHFRISSVAHARLVAWHPDFLRKSVEVTGDRVELVLERAPVEPDLTVAEPANQRLAGSVVDERGFPVGGARVEVGTHSALSDKAGQFEILGLPAGPYHVRATHADFAPTEVAALAGGEEARLQLLSGGGIEGELRDPRTGRLPAGATLQVVSDGQTQSLTLHDSRFTLTGLHAGRVTLSARAPGYATLVREVELPAGEQPRDITLRDLRLELERAGVIVGSVRGEAGEAVAGAQVAAGAANCRTDGRGEFRLEGVAPGRAHLQISDGGRRASEEVEVRSDEDSRADLTLR